MEKIFTKENLLNIVLVIVGLGVGYYTYTHIYKRAYTRGFDYGFETGVDRALDTVNNIAKIHIRDTTKVGKVILANKKDTITYFISSKTIR